MQLPLISIRAVPLQHPYIVRKIVSVRISKQAPRALAGAGVNV